MRFVLLLFGAALVVAGVGAIHNPAHAAEEMNKPNAAHPVRVSQVNAALRQAGLPVNEFSQRSFAAGVVSGHYKTFEQLVDAMMWHKAQGKTIANFGSFKGFDTPPIMLRARGYIANVEHHERIELRDVNVNGHLLYQTFHMSLDTIVEPHMMRGMPVEVEYLPGSKKATKVRALAPEHAEAYYGPVDCSTCPGASK